MDSDAYKKIEDFLNNMGFNNNTSGNSNDFRSNPKCGEDPWGLQYLNPELVIVLAELIGNISAGNMPFNLQNLVGNWLMLLGQAIITFNAQQQYMQSGPGRYFDFRNANVNNPFCSGSVADIPSQEAGLGSNTMGNASMKNNMNNVDDLINYINLLSVEIKDLKYDIEKLKKNNK